LYFKIKSDFVSGCEIKSAFENAFGPSEPPNPKVNSKTLLNFVLRVLLHAVPQKGQMHSGTCTVNMDKILNRL